MKRIAIVGLGLMGGSMAKALSLSGKYQVIGYNRSPGVAEQALKSGCIGEIWNGTDPLDADITVLAVSPAVAERFLENSCGLLKKGSILTDICGVKRKITSVGESVCQKHGLRFVGGHPMAGKERSGFSNSTASLFDGRSYILTKTENTDPDAIRVLSQMALDMGCADVTLTTPDEHDRMIAYTSQLPHVLAGAYVKSPTCERHKGFSAGSYQDVSRVAGVDENLWSELFLENGDHLLGEIDLLIKHLTEYRTAIAAGDREAVSEIIKRGREIKQRDLIKNNE